LAAYGGSPDAAASLKAFEAQFRTKGQAAKSSMGQSARRFFQASSAVVGVAWLLAPITSAIINSQPSHASETQATPPIRGRDCLQIDKLFDVKLPRSWFAPTSASCSTDAKNIAVTDGIRAFVTGPNISEMVRWQEPQSFCEGTAVTAVALSSKGEVFVARENDCHLWPADTECKRSPLDAPQAQLQSAALDGAQGIAVWRGRIVMLEPSGRSWAMAGALPMPKLDALPSWSFGAIHEDEALAMTDTGELYHFSFSLRQ